jgi:uncharacterized protein YbcI
MVGFTCEEVPGLQGLIGMHAELKEEIQSALVSAMVVFLRTHMGEQVATVSAEAGGKTVTVRVKCVLPPAEKILASGEEGFNLLSELKTEIMARAEPLLKAQIETLANTKVTGIHSSFRVDAGECIKIFTLNGDLDAI